MKIIWEQLFWVLLMLGLGTMSGVWMAHMLLSDGASLGWAVGIASVPLSGAVLVGVMWLRAWRAELNACVRDVEAHSWPDGMVTAREIGGARLKITDPTGQIRWIELGQSPDIEWVPKTSGYMRFTGEGE